MKAIRFSESSNIQELLTLDREIVDLAATMGVLGWDQEVNMPKKGVGLRSKQLAALAGVIHDRVVNPRIGELIERIDQAIKSDPTAFTDTDLGLVREVKRSFDQATKLPKKLVQDLTESTSIGQQMWERAREEDNFSLFAEPLNRILEQTREKAEKLGYTESPYDALLDEYEIGLTEAKVREIFGPLRNEIVTLLKQIEGSNQTWSDAALKGEFAPELQLHISKEIATWLGYDFAAGRLDLSAHPFTSGFGGGGDVRITTRIKPDQIDYAIMPTIHETGHAVYDQNVSTALERTSLSGGVSLGIHESQSRFFENQIGRSLSFWRYWYPKLQDLFFDQLPKDGLMDFYRAINLVRPSLIRTEADEVTYNLHIILRFELEADLIHQRIAVSDLPDLWREKMNDYLGIIPATDKDGVLQDVHWAHGSFGYFPTYTLGNLYSAQFANTMGKTINIENELEKGDYTSIRQWLTQNIHQWGGVYVPDQLCRQITGEALNPHYFTDYLKQKYSKLYEFLPTKVTS